MKPITQFTEQHQEVKAWLQDKPKGTQRRYGDAVRRFSEETGISPEHWRSMDKFMARDKAWGFIQPLIKDHSGNAHALLAGLKSFYRNKNGEQLPFDSQPGGKHYLRVRRKKAATEHIPDKAEMYRIIDMASNLRDKAMLMTLFQAGVRVNVIEHLTYGDVKNQLDKDTVPLKVTGNLDHKLRGRDIPFYYTFLNGEGARTLKQYCERSHGKSKDKTPLFKTSRGRAVHQAYIWLIVKRCVEKAGFDQSKTTTHTIRKAFRKIVRQANIDDDTKEELMGHVLAGSRENYFDRNTPDLILQSYRKCNFTREQPESEVTKLRKLLEDSETKRTLDLDKLNRLERELETLKQLVKQKLET